MFSKENLHHAYCIEGDKAEAIREVKKFLETELNLSVLGNPDVLFLEYDTFTINDGRVISEMAIKKPFGERKIFTTAFNFITREAQNSLLKLFEEPTAATTFFLIVPSAVIFLPTLKSRLMIIGSPEAREAEKRTGNREAEFLKAPLKTRLEISKKLADSVSDEEKSKAEVLEFLEEIEQVLHQRKSSKGASAALEEVMKAKRLIFGRSPATKMILEHIALVMPPQM